MTILDVEEREWINWVCESPCLCFSKALIPLRPKPDSRVALFEFFRLPYGLRKVRRVGCDIQSLLFSLVT